MLRRTFIATAILLLTEGRLQAQQPGGGEPSPREVFDFQAMVSRALAVATRVDGEAEQLLRTVVGTAVRQLELPPASLRDLSPARVPGLLISQHNLPTLLFGVLQAGKTAEGQVVVTRAVVERSLRQFCPLYPFC
jgi:hypothetical protein